MKQPQTAVLGAADNTVVLYFLQALWSHRIMQSLPHDKDAQPWGSYTDLLFPRQNKCHTSLTLQMPHEESEPGSKQLAHSWKAPFASHVSLCRLQPSHSLPTIQNTSRTLKSVCGQVHTHADKHATPQKHTEHEAFLLLLVWEIRLPHSVFSLSLCFEIFSSVPVFMSSSAALKSTRDKDRRMKTRSRRENEVKYRVKKLPMSKRMNMKLDTNEGNMAGGRGQLNLLVSIC